MSEYKGQETVPCIICGEPTPMLGTQLCNRCWELKNRIEMDKELAAKILVNVYKSNNLHEGDEAVSFFHGFLEGQTQARARVFKATEKRRDELSEKFEELQGKAEDLTDVVQDCPISGGNMCVRTYKKKPIVIQALQWTGLNHTEMLGFTNASVTILNDSDLFVETLEGRMHANPGDYIIRGVRGEYYPCEKSIFEETYEEVFEV